MAGNKKIKVAVLGTGPVGMIMAVKLQEAGCDVTICVRNKIKLNHIKSEGIKLEGVMESTSMFKKAYGSIEEVVESGEKFDYIVFSLKSYQITKAAQEAMKLDHDDVTVISAQNGIDVEELLVPVFGTSKIVRMVVNYAGNLSAPNVVRVTFFTPPNYLGSIDDAKTKEAEAFADILNSVKLTTKVYDSFGLLRRVWEKTILNASLSPLCGVGRLTMAEAMADEETVELIEEIINEAVEVAEAEKIRFPDDFIRNCMRYLRKGGNHFPSLAGDLINNRITEIDYFNGKIVEYGKKHYTRTSLNLAFTNMVKAMTNKNILSRIPGAEGTAHRRIVQKGLVKDEGASIVYKGGKCFLGVDLGSAYIKFTIIDENKDVVFRYTIQTLGKDRMTHKHVMKAIHADFDIQHSCATGYGRKHFIESDIIKTEINSAAAGVSKLISGEKNIIDIGGEDIKVIRCDKDDRVADFSMNDKCAAGTGSFLTEIAERAEIDIAEMSYLAGRSSYEKELNSFCTVFAKTEIMNWIFDGMDIEDIARGIYLSIGTKVAKMRLVPGVPTYMIGGVIAHHPYLQILLNEKFDLDIQIMEEPQHIVSLGAAVIASKHYYQSEKPEKKETTKKPAAKKVAD